MAGHSKDKLEKFAQALAEGKTPVTQFAATAAHHLSMPVTGKR